LKERLLDKEKIIEYFKTPSNERKVSEETNKNVAGSKFKSTKE
jgi:hypothetical protein